MTFEWVLDESIPDGVARLMQFQIDFIVAQLKDEENDRDEAVHEARKSFKKIRALLRLIRDEIGEDVYREHNDFYRDLSRLLAPLRDDFVLVEIMDALILDIEDNGVKKVARKIRKDLNASFKKTRTLFWKSGEAVEEVITRLEDIRETAGQFVIERDSFKVFKKGLYRVYNRGKTRMDIAYASVPSPEGFHDWRKRVKYLWYQLRILEPLHPAKCVAILAQLEQLAGLLGKAHDLAVLYERIANHPQTQDGDGRMLLAFIDVKRGELEASARPYGEAIYEADSKEFVNQIEDWWKNPHPITASPF